MNNRYVIIGSSAAGMAAAGKLRELDQQSRILCLSADKQMPYNRCLLADVLSGSKTEDQIRTRTRIFLEEKRIELLLDTRIDVVDAANQHVVCSSGTVYGYDKLFIGTGKAASCPPIPGHQAAGVFTLYDLDDVLRIQAYIRQHNVRSVVVIGGGLTGLECADALTKHVECVALIERAMHILPHQIDEDGARFLQHLAAQQNIEAFTGTSVSEIQQRNGHVSGIKLVQGDHLACQLVVMAVGAVIQSKLALRAGLEVAMHGIVVSDAMQTSHHSIYAGGDVCQVRHHITQTPLNSSLWPDAVMQGLVAATNMVGQHRVYTGIVPITSSTIFGTTFVTCMPLEQDKVVYHERSVSNKHYHLLYRDAYQQLLGFVMVGNIENLGVLRKALLRPV